MATIDKLKAAEIVLRTIKLGEKGYHKYYDRTVHLANLYEKLITGEDIASLLKQYTPRESEEQFKQRVNLTELVTPAVAEKIKTPFYKVSRIDNVTKGISFNDKDSDATDTTKKLAEIEEATDNYFGDETLDDFMETVFVDLSFSDPNAFIVTEFNAFDAATEKAEPFPVIVPSLQAVNYKYINNTLSYLIVKKPLRFKMNNTKETLKDGNIFIIYTCDFSIKLTQFDGRLTTMSENITEESLVVGQVTTVKIGSAFFKIELFEPKSGEIQAIRVGYKRDLKTKGETFVNPFHPALARFKKTIKSISELDLTTTLHVFSQKIQYVQACVGDRSKGDTCSKGTNRNGEKCAICKGSGVILHKSSSDAITLPLPKKAEDMFDLDKLLVYKNPSIDLIKFQEQYVANLEDKAVKDVFTSETFNRITAPKTLGEKELDMESIYDTLFPFGKKYSAVYRKQVRLTANLTDNGKDITVIHSFPKDLKLKTISAMLADLEQAKEADAPTYIKTEIATNIANKMWADNPDALSRFTIKQQHIPFLGRTPEDIQLAINNRNVTKFDSVLYSSFESIINTIEAEQLAKRINFFDLSYDKRTELIKAAVDAVILQIKSDTSTVNSLDTTEEEEGTEES